MKTVWDYAEEGDIIGVLETFGKVERKGNRILFVADFVEKLKVGKDKDGYSISVGHYNTYLKMYEFDGKVHVAVSGKYDSIEVGHISGRIESIQYEEYSELDINKIFDKTLEPFKREGKIKVVIDCGSEICI